ncbi:MAG: TlpA family protein disulfide reductase [Candidatus Eremiobacteraeota bacterium]|nr:TlpA family protein disulfide reductase [Candidatus Eremiobacteraeota bacterium]
MSTRSERRRQAQNAPKNRRKAWLASAALGLAIIAIAAYAIYASKKLPTAAVSPSQLTFPARAKAGTRAKPFSVQAAGVTFSAASLAGKPYMLELFATWCPHCQRMTSVLRSIRARIPERRFAMLSVTASPYAADSTADKIVPENQQDVERFDAAYGVTWPTAFDPQLSVAKTWGLVGFPTFYIVNAAGTIVFSADGDLSEKTLLAAIKKAGG